VINQLEKEEIIAILADEYARWRSDIDTSWFVEVCFIISLFHAIKWGRGMGKRLAPTKKFLN